MFFTKFQEDFDAFQSGIIYKTMSHLTQFKPEMIAIDRPGNTFNGLYTLNFDWLAHQSDIDNNQWISVSEFIEIRSSSAEDNFDMLLDNVAEPDFHSECGQRKDYISLDVLFRFRPLLAAALCGDILAGKCTWTMPGQAA